MSRSKETYGKKEVRNKRLKKRKEKEQRKLEKKEQGRQSIDEMIAYVTNLNPAFRFEKFPDFDQSLFRNNDAAIKIGLHIIFENVIDC